MGFINIDKIHFILTSCIQLRPVLSYLILKYFNSHSKIILYLYNMSSMSSIGFFYYTYELLISPERDKKINTCIDRSAWC